MLDIFQRLFDLIAPPHPVITRLRLETPETFRRFYKPRLILGTIVLACYSDPVIKAAITANKFHDHKPAAVLLASLLEQWLKTTSAQNIILVPVPLSPARERDRGYNQVTRILSILDQNLTPVKLLLTRTRNTPPQTSLGRSERLTNVAGVFSYQEPDTGQTSPFFNRLTCHRPIGLNNANSLVTGSSILRQKASTLIRPSGMGQIRPLSRLA